MAATARHYDTILSPVITEKATLLSEQGKVVFRVADDATKDEIAAAVEELFKVKVEEVRLFNVRGKMKRLGRWAGKRRDWRKAYVRLKAGEKAPEFVEGV